jgi:hypothetical protein
MSMSMTEKEPVPMMYKDPPNIPSTSSNPRLDAALACAARGWPVFPVHTVRNGGCSCGNHPCAHPGKHPLGSLVSHGLKDASTNKAIISQWWTEVPDANLGI